MTRIIFFVPCARAKVKYKVPFVGTPDLALSGGNTWLKKGQLPTEAEDGLLTAEDVTGMDLLDTELVALSACNTGLGEIRIGEGVFGLRRAFVRAGAKTLVMSLGKVPDEELPDSRGPSGLRRRSRPASILVRSGPSGPTSLALFRAGR